MYGVKSALMALSVVVLVVLAPLSAEQQPALRCRHPRCRYNRWDDDGEYYRFFYTVDDYRITISLDNEELTLICDGASLLESPALPRAEPALRMSQVMLVQCPPPKTRSLADTLAAINVTLADGEPKDLRSKLKFMNLPKSPQLTADHFAGFERLIHLDIIGNLYDIPRPARGFLEPLPSLRSLEIWHVVLPVGELDALSSLRELRLFYVEGVEWLPAIPTLESLKITNWTAQWPPVVARCESLRELYLAEPAAIALPDGWLANCSLLEQLEIREARHLTTLPAKLLIGTGALRRLILNQGALETLPAGLLDYSPELHTLSLLNNRLRTLPSGMFALVRQLRELDLFWNDLDGRAADKLAPLDHLTELNLGSNPRLGDLCGTDGYSPICNSTKLKKLGLSWTGVTHICRDWRDDMTELEILDLSASNITELSFEEMQFTRKVKAEVLLIDVPVTVVKTTREDYNNGQQSRGLSDGVSVQLRQKEMDSLECDCRIYWTRRALYSSLPKDVGEQTCSDGRRLRHVPPEELMCPGQGECVAAALPAACACAVRPDGDSDRDRLLVRARCENASLTRVPRPLPLNRSTERLYELLLRYNNITELNANDLQSNIKGLDLRNNSLTRVDEETAARLGAVDGSLLVAGNLLDCSCGAASLLRALHGRAPALTDLDVASCAEGGALYAAPTADCLPLAARVAIVLAVLLVLVVAGAVLLASRERRFFMMAVLHRWGVVWYAAEPAEDDDRLYDAFLTFSHKDEDVALEMMNRLEPTYRLCVHHRDWIPGIAICAQVTRSVRDSRRTIALVSKQFLLSSWTIAEFREAHSQAMLDAKMRLVVVMLQDPATLDMDEHLALYIATHTYLRWGEPWFWNKLAVALPRPRTAAPAPRDRPLAALELEPMSARAPAD